MLKVTRETVDALKPYEKNAKKHPKKQVEQVAASIKEFGFNQPIVIDQDNVIIVGHGRLEAAKLLGLKEVPVLQVDLTEEQAKAYRLADNKLNESEWDMSLVIDELKDLELNCFDIELTGFDKDLILEPDEKDDEVPDVPEEPKSKLGEIYQLGGHRLMCGSATELGDVEKLMDGQKADMVFTDPPYGVNYEGINNDSRGGLEELLREAFGNYIVSSKSGASAYVFHSDKCADIFHKVFREYYHFSSMIIWEKPSPVLSRTDYQSIHESILYGWGKEGAHNFFGNRKQTSIWKSDKEPRAKGHTTPKPVAIIEKALVNSSKSEDVVLDFFGGSGSTLIAAEKLNRKCYMMELDPKYIDVIIKRWEDYTGNKATKLN